jgi:class 3 adenylate cyclase
LLRAEVIDPKITGHHGRIVKTTGDGLLVEFASVVDSPPPNGILGGTRGYAFIQSRMIVSIRSSNLRNALGR